MNYEDRVTKEYVEEKLAECGNCKIYTGSYVGTGTYGAANPNTLTFPFEPKMVWVGTQPREYSSNAMLWKAGVTKNEFAGSNALLIISQSGKTVSWYNEMRAEYQLNTAGQTYHYLILG